MNFSNAAQYASTNRDTVRYLIDRGYITPEWVIRKTRKVREFSLEQATLLASIVRYHDADGLRWEIAYVKATSDLQQPRLVI